MDENEIINDSLNDESNFEQEVEQTFDNIDFPPIQNDDTNINMSQPNMNNTNDDKGLNIGLVNQLEKNIGD